MQDNWTAIPSLTVNAGLRYELTTARGDKNPQNNVNFDLLTGTPEIGTNYNTYKGIDNFQPRIGFAWQPGCIPRMVVRGAYDISTYMEGNGVNNMAVVNPPNAILNQELNNTRCHARTTRPPPWIRVTQPSPRPARRHNSWRSQQIASLAFRRTLPTPTSSLRSISS